MTNAEGICLYRQAVTNAAFALDDGFFYASKLYSFIIMHFKNGYICVHDLELA